MGKVFISYSHDSPEHSERVLALSNRLRAIGVDAELDRYHVRPSQGWPHWCEEQLRPEVSSFVLVICTPTYRARVENRVGADEGRGVYWEGAILYNYLYSAKGNSRFIPVLLDNAPKATIPLPLDGHTHYRIGAFELADPDFEALYRELTGQPGTAKPTLGDVIKLDAGGAPIATKALPEKKAVTDFASAGHPRDEPAAREQVSSEPGPTQTAAGRGGFWSPFSNEESVARGEVRFWAIFETLVAMAVFWWVAVRYETFLLLTTSLFVAPLLLLRSDESTRLGVKWIDNGMFPPPWPGNLTTIHHVETRGIAGWLGIGIAIGAATGVGLGYPVMKICLVGDAGWSAFGRGAGLGLMLSFLAEAVGLVAVYAGYGMGHGGPGQSVGGREKSQYWSMGPKESLAGIENDSGGDGRGGSGSRDGSRSGCGSVVGSGGGSRSGSGSCNGIGSEMGSDASDWRKGSGGSNSEPNLRRKRAEQSSGDLAFDFDGSFCRDGASCG